MCSGPAEGGGGTDDFVAAIATAQRIAVDGAIARQVLAREVAARLRHVFGVQRAERAGVQQLRTFARDAAQRLRVVAGDQPRAGGDRRAAGQIQLRDLRIARHVGSAIRDAFVQIRRDAKAARGMADRRLHHIGQREGAKPGQCLAPALQVAG